MRPNLFSELTFPTFDISDCSPMVPEDFVGIKIEAPEEVSLDGDFPIPFCGAYRLPAAITLKLSGSIIESIVVVVKDDQKHTPFSFNLRPDKDKVEGYIGGTEYPEIDEDTPVNTTGFDIGYFNIDLRTFYPDMSNRETTYIVYATLGEYVSNSVNIHMKK